MTIEHILKLLKSEYEVDYDTYHNINGNVVVTYALKDITGCMTMRSGRIPEGITIVSAKFADDLDHLFLMANAHHTLYRLIQGYATKQ